MKRICVYGKGGIGKSTAVSNLAAAMAQAGKRVAVVGCDPKADSTRGLMGRRIPTVLDQLKTGATGEIAFTDSRGVRCIEAGGPEPGTGCAGRGIIVAMEEIRSRGLLDDRDVVLYDVLGDVVCGGFSMPLREQVADEVYFRHHQRLHRPCTPQTTSAGASANTPRAAEYAWPGSSTTGAAAWTTTACSKPLRRSWAPRWREKFP